MTAGVFDVRTFGAVGDGRTLDTRAINHAIEQAAPTGGTVYFPPGTYLSYSIRLRSNVTVYLDRGAVLLAAGDPPPDHEYILAMLSPEGVLPGGGAGDAGSFYPGDHFGLDAPLPRSGEPAKTPSFAAAYASGLGKHCPPTASPTDQAETYDPPEPNPHDQYQDHGHSHWHNSLIWGENLENISIVGDGLIDGRGLTWNADPANPTANKALALKLCRNVMIRDLTIFRGGHFVLLATGCEQMTIDNLKIDSNRDGIDLDSCRHVTISNCQVNTPNDDAIVLKSSYSLGESRPCEDVTIRNCRLSGYDMGTMLDGTFGTTQKLAPDRGGPTGRIKLGTESNAGFRNVTITDCIFEHSRGLALEVVDGGVLEDITVTGLTMRDITSAPLFIRLGNRARGPEGTPVATARRISISNVVATDVEPRYATLISGIPGHFIEDVHLADIQIQYRGGGGKLDAKVQPAEKENAYPEPNMFGVIPAYGLYCRHVKNLRVENVSFYFMKPDQRPAVILKNVHNASFTNLMASRLPGVPGMVLHQVSRIAVDDSPPIANQHIERADHRNLA